MPTSYFSPTFNFDPWFLRYPSAHAPVMPSAPPYPDAPSCTVSWHLSDSVSNLGATVEDFISDHGLVFYDAVSEPPPPEPPPPPAPPSPVPSASAQVQPPIDFTSAVLHDHDPSHIVSYLGSGVLTEAPCVTVSPSDALSLLSSPRGIASAFVHAISELGCFPSISSGDAPLIIDCGASVFCHLRALRLHHLSTQQP